jgi:hypothetical protein
MNLERLVFGGATAIFGTVAWLKVRNGDFGEKTLYLKNGFHRQYEVFVFKEYGFSLFPHKAVVIEKADVPELVREQLNYPLEDWRPWSAFVHVRVISSLRPLNITVEKLPGEAYYMEVLTAELKRKPALKTETAMQFALATWAEKYKQE